MKKSNHISTLFAVFLITGILLITSCSKDDTVFNNTSASGHSNIQSGGNGASNPGPVTGLFNRDLIVISAVDDNNDITANFEGISFRFDRSMETGSGLAYAFSRWIAVQGNWNSDQNNGNNYITIALPPDPIPVVSFMNKRWLMTESGGTVTLTAANGESDMITLSGGKP